MLSEQEFIATLREAFESLTDEERKRLLESAMQEIEAAKIKVRETCKDDGVEFFAKVFEHLQVNAESAIKQLHHIDEKQIIE